MTKLAVGWQVVTKASLDKLFRGVEFWDVTVCRWVSGSRRFEGTYCL